MGKKTKVGKQRKDKFYQLAKETGYRSRAAFKLIQLNRRFEFLQKSQVCLDLCAAPGGWMQVAKQNMPVSSVVVGVDLFPIKPIAGCISLIGDITTDKCRQDIGKELQNWKADLVLHDGAPNVGQNWLYDAYQQSALTLSALKLATGFLRQGGWFVTKVFRSKDYNPLLWVFKQLFKKVHASKPQASRAESAEIFVVCQGYLAPAKLDPRFLDLKYVFQEVDMEPTAPTKFLRPDKQKKLRAEGYSEKRGVYNPVSVLEFVKSDSPVDLLQVASCLTFDSEEVSNDPSTTTEIKECCKDIKVLGRKDLKDLMSWGKALKKKYFSDDKDEVKPNAAETSPEVVMGEDEKELVDMDNKIDLLELEEARALKKKRKRANKERSKLQEKLNLKMVFKNDAGPIEEDEQEPLFNLHLISSKKILEKIDDQKPDVLLNSEEEEEDENVGSYKSSFIPYDRDGTRLDKSGKFYIESDEEETDRDTSEADSDYDTDREQLGFSDEDEKPRKKLKTESVEEKKEEVVTTKKKKSVRFSENVKMEESEDKHPLLTDLDQRDRETKRQHRAHLWFQKDAFKGLEKEDEEEYELEEMAKSLINKGGDVIKQNKPAKSRLPAKEAPPPLVKEDEEEAEDNVKEEEEDSSDTDSDYDVETAHRDPIKVKGKDGGYEIAPKEKKPKKVKLTESELALGAVMVSSRKTRRDIIDGAWNRYSFNDTNLPDWFVEDEKKHMRKEAPVPKELIEEYKKKQEELNARPIKKVIEARARKKKRALKKLERAKKKLEGLMEHPDVSEKEKARQIRRLYKKAKEERKEVSYVVSRKHTTGKRMRRPPGVKGRYRVVDPRLKKDKRATSAKQARQTKNKKRR